MLGQAQAAAAADTDAERAERLMAALEPQGASKPLAAASEKLSAPVPTQLSVAIENAKVALVKSRARALPPSGSPEHSLLLGRNAWIWAQIARDSRRGRLVRQEADRLEEELSELRAQLSRMRAVVEQARARVGRASMAVQKQDKAKIEGKR